MPAESKLAALVEQGCTVFYFYSTEPYLVRQAVGAACALLARDTGEEVTVLDGPAPDVEQLITAAGTISFFGTRRVVCLPELDPGAYSEKDLETFADTVSDVENAVLVFGSVFEADRTGKAKPGKRAQRVIAQCKKLGWAEELVKPGPRNCRAPPARPCWSAAARTPTCWKTRWTNWPPPPGTASSRRLWWPRWGWSAWRPTSLRWCG